MTLDAVNGDALCDVETPPLAGPPPPALDPRTRRPIEAPIASTLLRLAARPARA
jgi:hypothetical protein